MSASHRAASGGATLAAAMFVLACGDGGTSREVTTGGAAAAEGVGATDMAASMPGGRVGDLVVQTVVAAAPVPADSAAPPVAVYFLVMNEGTVADTLDAIASPGATATLHQQTGTGVRTMVPLAFAAIRPGETLRFAPGGRHAMLEGLTRVPSAGDRLRLTLAFRHAGRVDVEAPVVSYAELERVLSAGADAHEGH